MTRVVNRRQKQQRVPQLPGVLLLTVVCCVLTGARAHGDAKFDLTEFHLAGMTLCVDPESVQARLDIPNQSRAGTAHTELTRALTERLEYIFSHTGTDADFLPSCTGSETYTLLTAEVRYMDPEIYVRYGRQPYSYTLSIQVGRHSSPEELRALGMLPDNQYFAHTSDTFPEGDSELTFEQFVPWQAPPLIGQLASHWLEDNPVRSRWAWLTPAFAGGVLALSTGRFLFLLLTKRANAAV